MSGSRGRLDASADLVTHQALMQGMETWQVMDGDKVLTIRPEGRFKADNGLLSSSPLRQDWVSLCSPMASPRLTSIPALW